MMLSAILVPIACSIEEKNSQSTIKESVYSEGEYLLKNESTGLCLAINKENKNAETKHCDQQNESQIFKFTDKGKWTFEISPSRILSDYFLFHDMAKKKVYFHQYTDGGVNSYWGYVQYRWWLYHPKKTDDKCKFIGLNGTSHPANPFTWANGKKSLSISSEGILEIPEWVNSKNVWEIIPISNQDMSLENCD